MESVDRILRRAFPSRDSFSEEEFAFASVLLNAAMGSSSRASQLPTKFVAVGEVLEMGSRRYECVEADKVGSCADACVGCDLCKLTSNCSVLQCSPQDRRDGLFVWFKEC